MRFYLQRRIFASLHKLRILWKFLAPTSYNQSSDKNQNFVGLNFTSRLWFRLSTWKFSDWKKVILTVVFTAIHIKNYVHNQVSVKTWSQFQSCFTILNLSRRSTLSLNFEKVRFSMNYELGDHEIGSLMGL